MSGRQWVYRRGGTGVGAPLLALVLTMAALPARAFNMETCDGKPHQVTINTQAEAYLGE